MDRDHDEDAKRLVASLPHDLAPVDEAPPFWEVQSARIAEFPILGAGIKSRSRALQERYGIEFSVTTMWSSTNRANRLAGVAEGNIVITRPSKPDGRVAFRAAPGALIIGERGFQPKQVDEQADYLNEVLKASLEAN